MYLRAAAHTDTRKYYCFKRIMIQSYNTQKPFLFFSQQPRVFVSRNYFRQRCGRQELTAQHKETFIEFSISFTVEGDKKFLETLSMETCQ